MKRQITGFILGALFGGIVIFTVAAGGNRPTALEYKVVTENLAYNVDSLYTDALKQAATNGWDVVSTQVVPKSSGIVSTDDSTESVGLYVVLRRPKQ